MNHVDWRALWASPWEECAMGYPEKLWRGAFHYGEFAWACGPPVRAILYLEADGDLPPEATQSQRAPRAALKQAQASLLVVLSLTTRSLALFASRL